MRYRATTVVMNEFRLLAPAGGGAASAEQGLGLLAPPDSGLVMASE